MKGCSEHRKTIIEAVNDTASEIDRARLQAHLPACDTCASIFAELKGALELSKTLQREDPGHEFWEGYEDRLMERIRSENIVPRLDGPGLLQRLESLIGRLIPEPRLALQLAAAVIIVGFGIALNEVIFKPVQIEGVVLADATESLSPISVVRSRADAYLDRTKTVLLSLVNSDAEEDVENIDIRKRQQIAGELVLEAGFLQQELAGAEQERLKELVSDLEIILLQIANLESARDVPGIEMLKSGVDQKALLFKIEVEELRREIEQEAAPTLVPASSAI